MVAFFASRSRLFTSILVGITSFLVYLFTGAPGLMYTDSGELSAACSTLGIAHPTGYPLFTLLGNLWTHLPFQSDVRGLNIFAAVLTALSAAFLTSTILTMQRKPSIPIAACASFLYAFSSVVWAQGTSIEVYALHAVLFTLTLFAIAKSATTLSGKYDYLAAFFAGLMLANHASSVFLMPGIFVLWSAKHNSWKLAFLAFLKLLPLAILPLALYAYLPIRSAQEPPVNWGYVHRSLEAFLYHVKGTQFGVWFFSEGDAATQNAKLFFGAAAAAFLYLGIVPILAGVFRKEASKQSIGLILLVVCNLGVSFGYAIPDIESYFLPTFAILSIWFALGAERLLKNLKPTLVSALLVLPIIACAVNWKEQDLSQHRAVDSYVEWTLESVKPNAIIISRQWDFLCSGFWYKQIVEGARPDVVLIEKELLRRTWYIPYLRSRYPEVMKTTVAEQNVFLEWLARFESNADAFMAAPGNNEVIQRHFITMLNAFISNNPSHPVYITPELLNDEQGFATNLAKIPMGPLVLLSADSTLPAPLTVSPSISRIATSLHGKHSRLDDALREAVSASINANALYAREGHKNSSLYSKYYSNLEALND